MRKELIMAIALSALLHVGLLFGFNGNHEEEVETTTVVMDVELTEDETPPPPPPPPAVVGESEEQEVSDVLLPEDLLAPGLSEPPPTAVTVDVLAQFVKPEAPRPPRPDSTLVGIPTGAQRAGAAGAKAALVFTLEQLDRVPAARYRASPRYPEDLRRAGINGSVQVMLYVDPQGRVMNAEIFKSDNPGFNQAALDAAFKWRFEPGVRQGEAVSFKMLLPLNFTVN